MEVPISFEFPFQPYSIQHAFMQTLFDVIENKKFGIFESPTGTGKSLSILCGAIRWLKDHNTYQRETLKSQIEELEIKKRQVSNNSTDWLSTQAQEIELTRQINELKIQQNKIDEYDKKIENLKKKKNEKKFVKTKSLVVKEVNENEDDEIVLETDVHSDDEKEESDDESPIHRPTKIFICSRTHSQLSQFVGEIIKSPFGKNIRVASLASRQNYCINPNVNKLKNNSLINEKCLDMQKQTKSQKDADGKTIKKPRGTTTKCPYYKQTTIEDLKDLTLTEVQDIEDLVKKGKDLNACPYYSSRLAAEDAEVVLVPYNTILHKATREANGIDLKDNVIIIDEAHNLLEAMGQMYSSELTYNQIDQGLLQVKCYKQRFNTRFSAPNLLLINQLIFVITKLQQLMDKSNEEKTDVFTIENFVLTSKIDNFNMFRLVKFCKDSRIAQKVRSYVLKYPFDKSIVEKTPKKGVKDFLSSLTNKNEAPTENKDEKPVAFSLTNPLLAIISFLECLTYSYKDGRIFIHTNQDKSKMKLQFLLLNPTKNFEDIVKLARSVIVCGGTMKPIEEFRNRLFITSGVSPDRIVEFSCGHIIPPENILPVIMTEGPNKEKLLFNFERRMSMGGCITRIIQEVCKVVKGGIVVFFPSYNYENWVWQQIKDVAFGRLVFREPQDCGSVDSVLKSYSDAVHKSKSGALLLSVVGGKLSEGLNFSDDLGRCVIVVGLPYANITAPDLKEKMSYLDKIEGSGAGKRFYESLCMKAVNQSIGRAVRHKNDYATILLLDERYNRTATKEALPDWIKKSLKVFNFLDTFTNMQKFFEERKKLTM
ncbi:ATP-dependent DNA helicase DDX11 [Tribolium madens]|uniref:ATP-dependent DNA helicase DDX11 n=1 Tax=Tribolium madens TaxID=41895 RepID=UPI001CF729DE|nr:ATP-dependent DNA helicase DDX11 [Tribolium madens]